MKRLVWQQLMNWKQSPRRKPLILRGARQVGKTYTLQQFARSQYQHLAYFNFEEDPALGDFFTARVNPSKLVEQLSLYSQIPIEPHKTLLFLDEIQECNRALNALKYFCEDAPEYHVAAAGSLLGVTLSKPHSFPVGKVQFIQLFPMTFQEYLMANGQDGLNKVMSQKQDLKPLAQGFHQELISAFHRYLVVGGMPEVVAFERDTRDLNGVRDVQKAILDAYALDFAKHAPTSDVPKLQRIWQMIPSQLARENKKFLYSALKQGARAREYEQALNWLRETGLIILSGKVSMPGWPLSGYVQPSPGLCQCPAKTGSFGQARLP